MRGQVTLPDLALEILSEHALVQRSQNQNAGFVSWFCMTVLLQSGADFQREAIRTSNRYICQLLQVLEVVLLSGSAQSTMPARHSATCLRIGLGFAFFLHNCHEYDVLH